jgi:ACS family hexuronate transporter-like MFS transporter
MGEAGNWPAGIRVVAEWFPVRERSLASGIFNSGSSVGGMAAAPLVVFLSLAYGWRAAFAAVGVTGFLWLIAWLALYRTPAPRDGEPRDEPVPVRALLRMRFIRGFMLMKLFFDPVWYFYIFWFPEYLKNGRGIDMATIGKVGWLPFLAADAGNLAGGWLCGWLLGRGVGLNAAKKGCVTAFALCMTAAIPAAFVESAWVSLALISTGMAGYTASNAVLLSAPADVLPRGALASAWGLCSMGSGFGGMAFALATGWVVDYYSYTPAFVCFGILPLVSALIFWTLTDSLDRAKSAEA